MQQISVVVDARSRPDELRQKLVGAFEIEFTPLSSIFEGEPRPCIIFDIDLNENAKLPPVKDWLKNKPEGAKVIFFTDKASHLQHTRAYAIGATDTVNRPVSRLTLLTKLRGDEASPEANPNSALQDAPGIAAADDMLKSMFSSASLGTPINPTNIQSASHAVVSEIEAQGLSAWVETVRMHHSQTYQHCLLVTGVAVAFGQQIGVSQEDRKRLSFAGMLHDIGKARIPLAILEKPGPLDANELAVMRKHPEYGLEALGSGSPLPAEMLDMVVHHHEYLDGSGYPHGLQASEISDLVRMMTISDVFGALIERRSYKAPLTGEAAYEILINMASKLDKHLVRAFKPVSQNLPTAKA